MTGVVYVASRPPDKKKKNTNVAHTTTYVKKPTENSKKPQITEVKVHYGFWARLLFYVGIAILIYLIFQTFIPLLQFKVYLDWWNKNGGKQYNNVFSINQFAYYGNFQLYAIIGSLMSSGLTTIQNKSQYLFILACISVWGKYDTSDDTGFLLPVRICSSIAVGDGYPDNTSGWKDLLDKWGVPQGITDIDQLLQKIDYDKWKDDKNFLYHNYGIPPNSPFILSFQSGSAEGASQEVWYPDAFKIAVGINPMSGTQDAVYGGWWGFINTGLSTEKATLSDIYRYLYAQEDAQLPYNPKPKCSAWGDATSILGQMATFTMAGAAAGPYGPAAGLVLGAVVGGITIGTKRARKSCQS